MKQQKNKKYQVVSLFGWFLTISLAVVSILPFFSFLFWPLELFSHFYLQYALCFILLVSLWLMLRKPKLAVLSLFGFLFSFFWLLPFYYQPNAIAQSNPNQSKLFTLVFNNLNYGNDNLGLLSDYVNRKDPQVVALVEIPPKRYLQLKQVLTNYPYSFYQPGANDNLGLVIFSKLPFKGKPYTHYFGQSHYPSIEVNFKQTAQPPLALIVIHPPPPLTKHYKVERDRVFKGLADYLAKKQIKTLVVGDFNATPFSADFKNLIDDGKVRETRLGRGVQPSWPTQLPRFMRIPIDHALVTNDIRVLGLDLGPDVGSDHLPFSLQLLISQD